MILTKPVTKLIVWPFIMVIFTIVFGMVGLKIDEYMGSPPLFMAGFMVLFYMMGMVRLYNEIKNIYK
jgi:hypothetical protein